MERRKSRGGLVCGQVRQVPGNRVGKDYGVVLRPEGWEIAREETRRMREGMRQARGGLKVIDRGEGFEQLLREGWVSLTTSDEG